MQISWDTTWQQLKDAFADYDVSHVDTGEVGFRDSVGCGTAAFKCLLRFHILLAIVQGT
jgi:hypothetical protein